MLPLYLQLGYPREDFIGDYAVNKLSIADFDYLFRNFRKSFLWTKWYNRTGIDMYIGKYFAAKACPNDSMNYEWQFSRLKKLDSELFEILETFMTAWRNYDYDAPELWDRSYHRFSLPFIEQLEEWTNNKTIR